ncbi:MAG: cation diffusion facilitator family transporter [Alphaproteobacteria bacterium]
MRAATYASVSVALVLIVVKAVALAYTDSVALLSSFIDSLLDLGASLINLVAVSHALAPADREHRFGHGKAESIAGLGQAAFITGSAVFLLFEAGDRLIHPSPVENGAIGVGVMAFSIVLTFALVQFQRYVVRSTGSVAISADSLHYKGDLLMNASVILALVLSTQLGWHTLDPIFAIAIAIYILSAAWKIVTNSFDMLMDREFADGERERIREIALSHAEVREMHDLRTRSSGTSSFIQFHLELDGEMTLLRAHEIADEVEAKIRTAFPAADVIIHQDPEGLEQDTPVF